MASEGRTRIWTLLIGAIGFGLAAAILSVVYLKGREAAILASLAGAEQQMVNVVVANANLPRGTQVGQGAFAVRPVPADFVHGDAIYPNAFDAQAARYLTTDLEEGKPLLLSFLDDEFPMDFSDTIKPGRRAITITVDDENSQASMLRPGNHIDLFVNIPTRESGQITPPIDLEDGLDALSAPDLARIAAAVTQVEPSDIIMPVVQDVRVIATGRDAYRQSLDELGLAQERSERRYSTLTLDVSPEHAALIRIAEDKGALLAMLRNRNDRGTVQFVGKTAQDLFAAAEATAAQAKLLAAQGLTLNENGEYVDADGNVVNPTDVIVRGPDGRMVDGNGNPVPVNEQGFIVAADGTVMTSDGQVLGGMRVNENGKIIGPDGTVETSDGELLSGVSEFLKARGITLIIGGASTDGVAKVTTVPVTQ